MVILLSTFIIPLINIRPGTKKLFFYSIPQVPSQIHLPNKDFLVEGAIVTKNETLSTDQTANRRRGKKSKLMWSWLIPQMVNQQKRILYDISHSIGVFRSVDGLVSSCKTAAESDYSLINANCFVTDRPVIPLAEYLSSATSSWLGPMEYRGTFNQIKDLNYLNRFCASQYNPFAHGRRCDI